jgi:hypothetical protein
MSPRRRWMYRLLPIAPKAVPLLSMLGPRGVSRVMSSDMPPCDQAIVARIQAPHQAMEREAFRQGAAAFAEELAIAARPWGFRLEDVASPTWLWHGEQDVSTRSLARDPRGAAAWMTVGVQHLARCPELLADTSVRSRCFPPIGAGSIGAGRLEPGSGISRSPRLSVHSQ